MSENSNLSIQTVLDLFKQIEDHKNVQALKELGSAIEIVLKNEKAKLSKDIYEKDLIPIGLRTLETTRKIKSIGGSLLSFSKDAIDKIKSGKKDELVGELKEKTVSFGIAAKDQIKENAEKAIKFIPAIRSKSVNLVDRINNEYQSLASEDEKARYILKLALYGSVFAIGFYQGNELPDKDFKIWGAGAHRSFLSHSVAPFIVAASSLVIIKRVLDRAENHLDKSTEAYQLSQSVKTVISLFGLGLGSGMAFHLAVDGLVQTGGTIRFHDLSGNSFGSLIPGTRIDDMAYTTAMSFFTAEAMGEADKKLAG